MPRINMPTIPEAEEDLSFRSHRLQAASMAASPAEGELKGFPTNLAAWTGSPEAASRPISISPDSQKLNAGDSASPDRTANPKTEYSSPTFFSHMESPNHLETGYPSSPPAPAIPTSTHILGQRNLHSPDAAHMSRIRNPPESGSRTPHSPPIRSGAKTPQSPFISSGNQTPRITSLMSPHTFSPIGTPVRKAVSNMKSYLEDIGHLTKFNPQDSWLPITESRTGNSLYAAFHNLNAGIGFQGLLLPFAMFYLGWTWGILSLILAYGWQLYTMWILIRLHEAIPGIRQSRYVQLAQAAFGDRLGYWLATPPNLYLTAGTATAIMVVGGGSLKLFFKIICGPNCGASPLTTIEWYLVFAMLSAVLAQLPNLNSIAGVSLVGALTAIIYSTMLWTLSISRERPPGVSYTAEEGKSFVEKVFLTLNALGIVAFAFRGHNLAMEIQATMPSSLKHPAHVPMWRGTKVANAIVGVCYFPIAISGYWAYGSKMLPQGILFSIYAFHQRDISRSIMGLLFLLVVINCLSSFQIYSFTIFDNFEAGYTAKRNGPVSSHVRVMFRVFYVFVNFFIAAAFPWLASLSGLLGGLSSAPVTFAYPCFMWLAIMKPKKFSFSWYLNWTLGVVGMGLAVAFTAGGIWSIVDSGIKLDFFKTS
ncbi:hypothetical protein GOP47_0016467 [Adiantum capillus-veneris]|uniref:Amino acid transporter transmembrane domain-containing protein n=1 Tax=Adiantum capillus-veneris TaxID=13818 RepID=A0A9D4ZBS0_ADICA|nr:hypothetical protein GOP47_0016467 [Adiantum capillus-veneris]